MKPWLQNTLILATGIGVGGWLFADSQPRSLLNVVKCDTTCLRLSDVAGLAASIGIQKFPEAIPLLVAQSDTCVAIRHPYSPHVHHYVFFPRRDIRNIGTLAQGDERYVMGCMALMGRVIQDRHLDSYRMYSNGPLQQDITYLHFHLVSD
jgi:hypothetical protein